MGSALTTLAASILVYRLTGSALSVGLMLIATAGPTVLIGMFAGVIVDRYDKKHILLSAKNLEKMEKKTSAVASYFHQLIIQLLAERTTHLIRTVAALEK